MQFHGLSILVLLSLASAGVQAAEVQYPSDLAQGIELVRPGLTESEPSGDPTDAGHKAIQVRPGDVLDTLIRTHLHPRPEEYPALRQAIVRQNPGAFLGRNPGRLIAGAALTLPSTARGESEQSRDGSGADGESTASSTRWVHFP